MDDFIELTDPNRCSYCGIMLDSIYAEGGDGEYCGACILRYE